jgi:hypothetical protein
LRSTARVAKVPPWIATPKAIVLDQRLGPGGRIGERSDRRSVGRVPTRFGRLRDRDLEAGWFIEVEAAKSSKSARSIRPVAFCTRAALIGSELQISLCPAVSTPVG